MLNNAIMKGKDALSAKLAECFVTIEGRRYNFMQAINLEAKRRKQRQRYLFLARREKATRPRAGQEREALHSITIRLFSVSF